MKYYVVYIHNDPKIGACIASDVVCVDGIETEDDIIEITQQLTYKDNNPVIINWKLLA
jgi:hypothetical protein